MAYVPLKKLEVFLSDIENEGDFMILDDDEVKEMESCYDCGAPILVDRVTRIRPRENQFIRINGKGCPSCGRLYIPYRALIEGIVIGLTENPEKLIKRTSAYKKRMLSVSIKIKQAADAKSTGAAKREENKEKRQTQQTSFEDISIRKNVFLVKTHTFSCNKAGHEIERVDARINILDRRTAGPRELTIPAGYCKQCRRYFIYMSDYERILELGVPLCNIINVEDTGKKTTIGRYHLKEESILMQHGYNVNAQENLSKVTRQRLLGLLIDYDICPKTQIVSYLDLFISQRRNMRNMENAISKWKEDRAFVMDYKKGTAREVWIRALKR